MVTLTKAKRQARAQALPTMLEQAKIAYAEDPEKLS